MGNTSITTHGTFNMYQPASTEILSIWI